MANNFFKGFFNKIYILECQQRKKCLCALFWWINLVVAHAKNLSFSNKYLDKLVDKIIVLLKNEIGTSQFFCFINKILYKILYKIKYETVKYYK